MHITLLSDNQVFKSGLKAEHGFSALLEAHNYRLLFDTGQTGLFLENAEALNIDLDDLDGVVISHGHYDHMGGLIDYLKTNSARVYALPGIFVERFSRKSGRRLIGAPLRQTEYERAGARFLFNNRPFQLDHNIILTGMIPRRFEQETVDDPFWKTENGVTESKDTVEDEQALVVKTEEGLVIMTGCGHAGLINTIHYAREITGENRIHTIFGGFHLRNAPKDRIDWTIAKLDELDFKRIIPSHCTGAVTAAMLYARFNSRVRFHAVGDKIEFNGVTAGL